MAEIIDYSNQEDGADKGENFAHLINNCRQSATMRESKVKQIKRVSKAPTMPRVSSNSYIHIEKRNRKSSRESTSGRASHIKGNDSKVWLRKMWLRITVVFSQRFAV